MPELFPLTRGTDWAIRSILHLVNHPKKSDSISKIALALEMDSPAHLAKVLQTLKRRCIVESTRGMKGGYRLLNPDVTLREVIEAMEGPIGYHSQNIIYQEFPEILNEYASKLMEFLENTPIRELR